MKNNYITRREAIVGGLSSLISLNFLGCNCQSGLFDSLSRTLEIPGDFTKNMPSMNNLINIVRDMGFTLNFPEGPNHPCISGEYRISGKLIYPYEDNLASGTFSLQEWTNRNLRPFRMTDLGYRQITGQIGSSLQLTSDLRTSTNAIIEGYNDIFTITSLLKIKEDFCLEEFIGVFDGVQDEFGNVSAIYFMVPKRNESCCFLESAGILDLELIGDAETKYEDNIQGASLLARA